jgi:ATP-dependent 26S proteasome regulatory subunit
MSYASYASSILATVIADYLPFGNSTLKMTFGMLGGKVIESVSNTKAGEYWNRIIKKNRVMITNENKNPIYTKFEEYLVEKYFVKMNSCELVHRNGEVSTGMGTLMEESKTVEDTFKIVDRVHNIKIIIEKGKITIESKTLTVEQLRLYVNHIMSIMDRFRITINNNEKNPIYTKLEEYLVGKFFLKLSSCEINHKNGELNMGLDGVTDQKKTLEDTYEEKTVANKDEKTITHSIKIILEKSGTNANVTLESKTANIDTLRKYVETIVSHLGRQRIIISDGDRSPIYYKIEEYLISKFQNDILNCGFIPKNGEVTVSIDHGSFSKSLEDTFEYVDSSQLGIENKKEIHKIKISMEKQTYNHIIIESKTANFKVLKKYVENIMNMMGKSKSKVLRIHRPYIIEKKDEVDANWTTVYVPTNKTFKNTIVNKSVEKDLIEDVKWFMENEKWFSEKGIPYKRGYILYGPPGTGKTSIIKAIANEYGLEVFSIELENIKTNNQLMKLMTDINYRIKKRGYILTFEDIDRSPFIQTEAQYGRGEASNKTGSKITMTSFINLLDGIVEANKRILIMTANDVSLLQQHTAMVRPGRIDKQIMLDYCDLDQLTRLFTSFHPDYKFDESSLKLPEGKLSPADFIKLLQVKYDKPDDIISFLKSEKTESAISISTELKVISEETKSEGDAKLTRFYTTLRNKKNNLKWYTARLKKMIKLSDNWEANKEKMERKIESCKKMIERTKTSIQNRANKLVSIETKKKQKEEEEKEKKEESKEESKEETKSNKRKRSTSKKKPKINLRELKRKFMPPATSYGRAKRMRRSNITTI